MALSKVGLIDAAVITGETALAAEPATTDELLLSDAGTLKRMDFVHIINRKWGRNKSSICFRTI